MLVTLRLFVQTPLLTLPLNNINSAGERQHEWPKGEPDWRFEEVVRQEQVEYVEFWLMLASALIILVTIILCFLKLRA